ncbi:N-carbamoylsarcosine amidase, partial [Geodia barretti]
GIPAPHRVRDQAGAADHRPRQRVDQAGPQLHLRQHGRHHPRESAASGRRAGEEYSGDLHDDGLSGPDRAALRHRALAHEDPGRDAARRLAGSGIDERIAPMPARGEQVIVKKRASAFHGTYLAGYLRAQRVDTVIITGVTMAGCVRHSAEDAIAEGFRPIVVREGVGDRVPGVVEWNLFDIDAKFGDVEPVERVLAYLDGLEAFSNE